LSELRLSRWSVAFALGAIVSVAVGFGTASSAPVSIASKARLPVAQLVALARDELRGLGDPNVKTASVVVSTKNATENWMEPGAVPPSDPNPLAYLIVLQGKFTCENCSGPPTGKPPKGRSAQFNWIPGVGGSDFGLTRAVPPGLAKLGRVITLRLVSPRIPASEFTVEPGVGIGLVRLGVPYSALSRRIGPALGPGQWVFGPIEVATQRARNGRVDRLAVLSPQARIDRHPLGEGYRRLSHELLGWRQLNCGHSERVLMLAGPHGVSTRLQFAGGTFELARIGVTPPNTCLPPFPTG
jgi:hypothetical protein